MSRPRKQIVRRSRRRSERGARRTRLDRARELLVLVRLLVRAHRRWIAARFIFWAYAARMRAHMQIRRLECGDEDLARDTFAMMTSVFDEGVADLGSAYVVTLLARPDFWAMAALDGEEVVGGLTAHTLPMTRSPEAELFIYDLAVRADRQRRGIGRALVLATLDRAKAEGLRVAFVPADDEDGHAIAFYRAIGGHASPVTFFTFGDE